MTSRERAEALAADLDHTSRMGGIVDKAYLAKVVAAAIDHAVAEEREACAKVADENGAIATSKATKNVAYFVAEEIRARGAK
jgi:hypothetical protein